MTELVNGDEYKLQNQHHEHRNIDGCQCRDVRGIEYCPRRNQGRKSQDEPKNRNQKRSGDSPEFMGDFTWNAGHENFAGLRDEGTASILGNPERDCMNSSSSGRFPNYRTIHAAARERAGSSVARRSGNRTIARVPTPTVLSIANSPPRRSASLLTIARPRPLPGLRVVP